MTPNTDNNFVRVEDLKCGDQFKVIDGYYGVVTEEELNNAPVFTLLTIEKSGDGNLMRLSASHENGSCVFCYEPSKVVYRVEPWYSVKCCNNDVVNHPSHYTQGKIEVIDFINDQKMNYNLGNALKYICRCNYKGKKIEDLEKAIWYLKREIDISKDQ